jgi:hypothetical protein
MVANPYVFAKADSATAVAVGRAMRDRMARSARSEFVVITDSLMNAALVQYEYPRDAILNRADAQTLARQIAGRVLVTSQMSKTPNGQLTLLTRLSGTNDDAGATVRVSNTSPQALGAAAVEALQPALRSLDDARECMDQRSAKPDRARDAAQKALKEMPTNGLAHYCLAQLTPAGPGRRDRAGSRARARRRRRGARTARGSAVRGRRAPGGSRATTR